MFGISYFTEEAWSRWTLAVKELGGDAASVLSSYGAMYVDVEKCLATATPDLKERLTLRRLPPLHITAVLSRVRRRRTDASSGIVRAGRPCPGRCARAFALDVRHRRARALGGGLDAAAFAARRRRTRTADAPLPTS